MKFMSSLLLPGHLHEALPALGPGINSWSLQASSDQHRIQPD